MKNEISAAENTALPEVVIRLQRLEKQVGLINMKLRSGAGLPGFEFFIEADGEEIWSGLDLQTYYPEILEQYPDKELLINWRSFPNSMTAIYMETDRLEKNREIFLNKIKAE